MTEEWRDIPGYEGWYQVSDLGNVRSLDRAIPRGNHIVNRSGASMIPCPDSHGYPSVKLSMAGDFKTFGVHRLVALTFIGPNPGGLEVCHGDGDKTNNALWNLRYDTRRSNAMDEVLSGRNYNLLKTHCRWGHELSGENLAIVPMHRGGKQRACKICMKRYAETYRAKQRDARPNPQEKAVIEELRREREAAMIATGRNT